MIAKTLTVSCTLDAFKRKCSLPLIVLCRGDAVCTVDFGVIKRQSGDHALKY